MKFDVTKQDDYDIVTALRGPDRTIDSDYSLKFMATAMLRYMVGINIEGLGTTKKYEAGDTFCLTRESPLDEVTIVGLTKAVMEIQDRGIPYKDAIALTHSIKHLNKAFRAIALRYEDDMKKNHCAKMRVALLELKRIIETRANVQKKHVEKFELALTILQAHEMAMDRCGKFYGEDE